MQTCTVQTDMKRYKLRLPIIQCGEPVYFEFIMEKDYAPSVHDWRIWLRERGYPNRFFIALRYAGKVPRLGKKRFDLHGHSVEYSVILLPGE